MTSLIDATVSPEKPLQDVYVWLSGPRTADLVDAEDLLRSLGALPLDRAGVRFVDGESFFDDQGNELPPQGGEQSFDELCRSSLLVAQMLVHVGDPDPADLLIAASAGLTMVDLS